MIAHHRQQVFDRKRFFPEESLGEKGLVLDESEALLYATLWALSLSRADHSRVPGERGWLPKQDSSSTRSSWSRYFRLGRSSNDTSNPSVSLGFGGWFHAFCIPIGDGSPLIDQSRKFELFHFLSKGGFRFTLTTEVLDTQVEKCLLRGRHIVRSVSSLSPAYFVLGIRLMNWICQSYLWPSFDFRPIPSVLAPRLWLVP